MFFCLLLQNLSPIRLFLQYKDTIFSLTGKLSWDFSLFYLPIFIA